MGTSVPRGSTGIARSTLQEDYVEPKGRWNPSLWVKARNASAELAEGDDLVFTDDDCEPPCWWLD